jgi:hypothetical protein
LLCSTIHPFPCSLALHASLFILPQPGLEHSSIIKLIRYTLAPTRTSSSHLAFRFAFFFFSPGGSDRLAPLKQLNKPEAEPFRFAQGLLCSLLCLLVVLFLCCFSCGAYLMTPVLLLCAYNNNLMFFYLYYQLLV